MNGDEHDVTTAVQSTIDDFEQLLNQLRSIIEQCVRDAMKRKKVDGDLFVGVYIPVEWDLKSNSQQNGQWDATFVVRLDESIPRVTRREIIQEAYSDYSAKYSKADYPRNKVVRSRTRFMYTMNELKEDSKAREQWACFRH